MADLRSLLLVEDNLKDIELTLAALAKCQLAKIKSDAATRSIPVVMLTSSREESDLIRSYELGVNAFVVKPVDFNAFFQAIQDLGMFWGVLNETPPHMTAACAERK